MFLRGTKQGRVRAIGQGAGLCNMIGLGEDPGVGERGPLCGKENERKWCLGQQLLETSFEGG